MGGLLSERIVLIDRGQFLCLFDEILAALARCDPTVPDLRASSAFSWRSRQCLAATS
jgi:hypothetical protein